MSEQRKVNVYTCDKCGGSVVTIDRDEGVTPFILLCRAKKDCGGWMQSCFYRVPADHGEPTLEFYRASPAEALRLQRKDRNLFSHHEQGGLLLREIGHDSDPPAEYHRVKKRDGSIYEVRPDGWRRIR